MAWIFKPDGSILETPYWPSPKVWDIPHGSWGYPTSEGNWGFCIGAVWAIKGIPNPPKHLLAWVLLLE